MKSTFYSKVTIRCCGLKCHHSLQLGCEFFIDQETMINHALQKKWDVRLIHENAYAWCPTCQQATK